MPAEVAGVEQSAARLVADDDGRQLRRVAVGHDSAGAERVTFTGIPLRQTINESDLEIYQAALDAPAARAARAVFTT